MMPKMIHQQRREVHIAPVVGRSDTCDVKDVWSGDDGSKAEHEIVNAGNDEERLIHLVDM